MLTKKEINSLKLMYNILDGEKRRMDFVSQKLQEEGFPIEIANRLGYLYEENYKEDGNFESITEPSKTYDTVQSLIDEYYDVKISGSDGRYPNLFDVFIILSPKKGTKLVIYNVIWERRVDGIQFYDEPMAETDGTIFESLNLVKPLRKWLRGKSLEFIKKNPEIFKGRPFF